MSGCPGNQDLHALDLDGGRSRLTWLSAFHMQVCGRLDEDHVLVVLMHNKALQALSWLYSASLDGELERLPWGPVSAVDRNPEGRVVLVSSNFHGPEQWKRYRGGMVNRVRMSNSRREEWMRLLPGETASLAGPCWVGERIVFTSDLGARLPESPGEQARVWSVKPDDSDLRAHTAHTFTDGYRRDITMDGRRVIFHARGKLHVLDSLDAEPREVPVDLASGKPLLITVEALDRLDSVIPDHGGDGSLVERRGQAWFLTHRSGPARALSALPGVRIREAIPPGNTGRGVWVTDAEGENHLEITSFDGQDDPLRIGYGQLGRTLALTANPEGSEVVVASHDGAVLVANVAGNTVRKVGSSRRGEATGLVFSPNGCYLVWREALGNEGTLGRLVGHDFIESRPFELTRGQFNDLPPTLSLDGRYLYFLSSRTIDPVYDEINFDLGFTNTVRPYVIPLSAEDPVLFGPLADD